MTKRLLECAPLRTVFAVVDREEIGVPWRRVILSKVRKNTWEILDETGDSTISTVDCNEDKGSVVDWDMFYRNHLLAHVRRAVAMARRRKQDGAEEEAHLNKIPCRKKMRDDACIALKKGGRKMKENASKTRGDIKVGIIV